MDIALRPSDNTLLFGTWPCTTPSLANLCEVRGFFFFHHFLSQVRGAWRRRKNLHTKGPINDGHLESHHTHTSWGCAHIHCHQQNPETITRRNPPPHPSQLYQCQPFSLSPYADRPNKDRCDMCTFCQPSSFSRLEKASLIWGVLYQESEVK